MSALYNEYIIASNNSINDNKYNDAKLAKSPSHKIKKILKPILRMLRQKNTKKQTTPTSTSVSKTNSSMDSSCSFQHNEYEQQDFWACEVDENSANEELESRIFREIEQCQDDAAVYVYNNNDECELQPVYADQKFVPVHFARTEAGTFFWTTMQKPVDYELVQPTYCCSGYQIPQLQYGDRWVQA